MFFVSLCPLAPVSVVLLHTLFGSHLEWSHTSPRLTDYHLLIPDLPGHSRSRRTGGGGSGCGPLTAERAADLVAAMVRDHAHDGVAHLVGQSMGGAVALEVVRRHPDVVASVFVTSLRGDMGLQGFVASYPRLATFGLTTALRLPAQTLVKASGWVPEHQSDAYLREVRRNMSARLLQAGAQITRDFGRAPMVEVARRDKRIAVVASGRQDDVEATREDGRLLSSLTDGPGRLSRAFVVRDAIHAWNLQLPDVFARGVRAWVEGGRFMPSEFELLE
ncbi:alpha/beta-hydrolase [Xylariaceae sp. FL0804]|nr:alpha/beta-hydrolase [Xylariaceae sp. FL0804]